MHASRKMKLLANLMLIVSAAIWGGNFVAQRVAAEYVGPFSFVAARFLLGSCSLIPLILYRNYQAKKWPGAASAVAAEMESRKPIRGRQFLATVAFCGLINGAGTVMVQIGLAHTTASKAGFLTAIYIVFVPILGMFLFHKKTSLFTWVGVILTMGGLYLLCAPGLSGGLVIQGGDLIILLSTLFFALHIHLIACISPRVDGIKFVCGEFFFSGSLFTIIALVQEDGIISGLMNCVWVLLYAGIMAVGVGYSLQVTAQRYTDPTVAALLMSLEAVFSALCGVLVLHERMSFQEVLGSVAIMCAVIVAQLPGKPSGPEEDGEMPETPEIPENEKDPAA